MPKRTIELFIADIFVAIDTINRYTKKVGTVSALMGDEVASIIVTREFQIIGQAMKNIIDSADIDKGSINPEWRKIVDFRNIIVHEYFGLLYEQVFDVIKNKVPALEQQLIVFIQNYPNRKNL